MSMYSKKGDNDGLNNDVSVMHWVSYRMDVLEYTLTTRNFITMSHCVNEGQIYLLDKK